MNSSTGTANIAIVSASRRAVDFVELTKPRIVLMVLITAFVGFATLLLIPIPMIRELAIIASLGVAYKIVTNLMMLLGMSSDD